MLNGHVHEIAVLVEIDVDGLGDLFRLIDRLGRESSLLFIPPNWPTHNEVALRIRTQDEGMLADLREAALLVERDGARVAFPDTKPDLIGTVRFGESDRRGHECLRDPTPLPRLRDVESLDLDRLLRTDALGTGTPAKLGKSDELPIPFADERF